MRVSDLITKLEFVKNATGDAEVLLFSDPEGNQIRESDEVTFADDLLDEDGHYYIAIIPNDNEPELFSVE